MFDKMFAALFIICLVFILVTKTLGKIIDMLNADLKPTTEERDI